MIHMNAHVCDGIVAARTVREARASASMTLLPHTNEARIEADLLLATALGVSRTHLHAHPEQPLDGAQAERFATLVTRRAQGEPCAYLTGRREFWSLDIEVTPATLIPRPETERLVELILERLPADRDTRIADLGTGSGAVALAVAHERPRAEVIASDRSRAALAVAAGNARRLGLPNLHLLESDWLSAHAGTSLDLIASNPPYVRADDPHLAQGDLRFEPQAALVAGDDGLDALRRIVAEAPRVLRPGGWLLVEHGADQGASVCALLRDTGFTAVTDHHDLAGLSRVTTGQLQAVPGGLR